MAPRQLEIGEQLHPFEAPGRPTALGRLKSVEYIDSGSLLRRGSGFMSGYDWVLNPYSGCAFACDYCYARAFAPTAVQRESWGTWAVVKQNAVQLIEKATRARAEANRLMPGNSIYLASVTDPYQPLEGRVELTRFILEALLPLQPRLTIQTRSPLVTRDIDLLRQFQRLRVSMTITTDDDHVRSRFEPACPPIGARFAALEELRSAGIPIGVSVAPMLPVSDAAGFGRRLAALTAAEYVTQFFHKPGGRFRATTDAPALIKGHAGWSYDRYAAARDVIAAALAPVPLLEGAAGFAPPP
jgi:DNA repair photolyase